MKCQKGTKEPSNTTRSEPFLMLLVRPKAHQKMGKNSQYFWPFSRFEEPEIKLIRH